MGRKEIKEGVVIIIGLCVSMHEAIKKYQKLFREDSPQEIV